MPKRRWYRFSLWTAFVGMTLTCVILAWMAYQRRARRWYQFSLRMFFVLVTLVCVGFGYWVHRSREWIRQRHEWMDTRGGVNHFIRVSDSCAPGGLWLFGEDGAVTVAVAPGEELEARRLFPEAAVVTVPITFTLHSSASHRNAAIHIEPSIPSR